MVMPKMTESYKKKYCELLNLFKSTIDQENVRYIENPMLDCLCPLCKEPISAHGICETCNSLVCPKDVPTIFRNLKCIKCREKNEF